MLYTDFWLCGGSALQPLCYSRVNCSWQVLLLCFWKEPWTDVEEALLERSRGGMTQRGRVRRRGSETAWRKVLCHSSGSWELSPHSPAPTSQPSSPGHQAGECAVFDTLARCSPQMTAAPSDVTWSRTAQLRPIIPQNYNKHNEATKFWRVYYVAINNWDEYFCFVFLKSPNSTGVCGLFCA